MLGLPFWIGESYLEEASQVKNEVKEGERRKL
ncbi:unnamed protein product, partial [marine sediment metagenome]